MQPRLLYVVTMPAKTRHPSTVRLHVNMPIERRLMVAIRREMSARGWSLSLFVRRAVEEALTRQEQPNTTPGV